MEFIYYFIQGLVKILYLNILQENILKDVTNNLI